LSYGPIHKEEETLNLFKYLSKQMSSAQDSNIVGALTSDGELLLLKKYIQ